MAMRAPAHPGAIVKDLIAASGLTVGEAAERLGVSRQQLTRLTGRQSGVSAEMALRLEAVFGSTAEAWLRLQDQWELARLRRANPGFTRKLKRIAAA